MLLIFGLVRSIAKPSLIKVFRVSLHCSDMLNSKFSKNFAKFQKTVQSNSNSDRRRAFWSLVDYYN